MPKQIENTTIQKNLYDILKKDYELYYHESVLFNFLSETFEAKNTDKTVDIRYLTNLISTEISNNKKNPLGQLFSLYKKIHSLSANEINHEPFPVILKFLDYKISKLKVGLPNSELVRKRFNSDAVVETRKKIEENNTEINYDDLTQLLEYYNACDTFSRCYDYLSRMNIVIKDFKKGTSLLKPNNYLRLIELLFISNKLEPYELFKTLDPNAIPPLIKELFSIRNISFHIPLLINSISSTSVYIINESYNSYKKRRDECSIDQKMKDAKFKISEKKMVCTLNIYRWVYNSQSKRFSYECALIIHSHQTQDINDIIQLYDTAHQDALFALRQKNSNARDLDLNNRFLIRSYLFSSTTSNRTAPNQNKRGIYNAISRQNDKASL